MFRKFETPYQNFEIDFSPNNVKIIPNFLDNYYIDTKKFSVFIPGFIKKYINNEDRKKNFNLSLYRKYIHFSLEENGIPLINNTHQPIEFDITNTFDDYTQIISAKKVKFKLQNIVNDDVILALIYPGVHLANLQSLSSIHKQNPELFSNKISVWNFPSLIDYLLFPTISLPYKKIMEYYWAGNIKRIIASKKNITTDLEEHIPDGLRADIYTNRWGAESSFKDMLSILNLTKRFGYEELNGGAALYFIVDKYKVHNVCRTFNDDFQTSLINIGQIRIGNIGDKVYVNHFD